MRPPRFLHRWLARRPARTPRHSQRLFDSPTSVIRLPAVGVAPVPSAVERAGWAEWPPEVEFPSEVAPPRHGTAYAGLPWVHIGDRP